MKKEKSTAVLPVLGGSMTCLQRVCGIERDFDQAAPLVGTETPGERVGVGPI